MYKNICNTTQQTRPSIKTIILITDSLSQRTVLILDFSSPLKVQILPFLPLPSQNMKAPPTL